jgi:hypothetical protein
MKAYFSKKWIFIYVMLCLLFIYVVFSYTHKIEEPDYGVSVKILSDKELVSASNSSEDARKKTKAYSYLSLVDGVLEKHKTWAQCEKRVKGKSGVKFRKTISDKDESEIIKKWGM